MYTTFSDTGQLQFLFHSFFGILESMAPRFDDLQKGLLHDTCGDGGRYGLNHGFSAQRNGEASGRFSPNPCDMWISMYSTTQIIFTPWLLHVSRTLLTCIKQVAETEQDHTKPKTKYFLKTLFFPTKQRRNPCFSWHQPIPSCFGLVWNPRIQANIGWLVLRYQSYPLFGS